MLLYLVRHADVTVRPERPGQEWHLSREGRKAAESLAREPHWADLDGLHTSPEPKALATAQRIAAAHGLPIRIEADLREVGRREWVDSRYRELVRRYLEGTGAGDWERRDDALERVRRCVGRIAARHGGRHEAIVSHGLVLTLYLAGLLGLDEGASFDLWSRMRLPDVAVVDLEAKRPARGFGAEASRRERDQG